MGFVDAPVSGGTPGAEQGTLAIISGIMAGLQQPNATLVAVDPKTLEVLDRVPLPEPSTTPHVVSTFEGKTAIYICADKNAYRYFWDPSSRKLTADESWVVPYIAEGQMTGDAPGISGSTWAATANPSRTNMPDE